MRLPENLYLLYVFECSTLSIPFLVVLQKNIHQNTEKGKIELNLLKRAHHNHCIDRLNESTIPMQYYEKLNFYKTLHVNIINYMFSVWNIISVNRYNIFMHKYQKYDVITSRLIKEYIILNT